MTPTTLADEIVPQHVITDAELISIAERFMLSAMMVSNTHRPWSDNNYGREAMSLLEQLPTNHPMHPNQRGTSWTAEQLSVLWRKYFPADSTDWIKVR